jgi:nucleoside 2-deoxyribosyltransferase
MLILRINTMKLNNKGKIYLAGPEVFLPDANNYFEKTKLLCRNYGYEGISPFDGEPMTATGLQKAELIFKNNCRLIEMSDLIIANCNSFRGALMDDGTAFEIGYARALQKIIYGFIDHHDLLTKNVESKIETFAHASGYRIDKQGYLVNEDFGNTINLMMEMAIQDSGGKLVLGKIEEVLKQLP